MDENGPQRLICLNAWSLVGGTVWERLGGAALLAEESLGWVLRFQAWRQSQHALCLLLVDQILNSWFLLP